MRHGKGERQNEIYCEKIGTLIITLLIVSFLSFMAFSVIPGDAAKSKLGTEATKEQVEALQHEMGLDKPVLVRYGLWLKDFVTGDMGESYSYSMPVRDMLADKIPINITMVLIGFLIILLFSIPLGIFTAQHEGGRLDRLLMTCNQVIMSVPGFSGYLDHVFVRTGAQVVYARRVCIPLRKLRGFLAYLIAPSIAIALPKSAMAVKMLRSSVITQLRMDYVRTAYSRGNRAGRVLYRHVLKNALIPVLTFWAMTIADIMANSIILEQVFTIPGMGSLLITSISNRDYPVVQGIIVLIAAMVVIINFAVDILYGKIDPRIRMDA
ncbi:MAG: ABC transporter permease [Blautia marasmi]